jgi:hypothetical protein
MLVRNSESQSRVRKRVNARKGLEPLLVDPENLKESESIFRDMFRKDRD